MHLGISWRFKMEDGIYRINSICLKGGPLTMAVVMSTNISLAITKKMYA